MQQYNMDGFSNIRLKEKITVQIIYICHIWPSVKLKTIKNKIGTFWKYMKMIINTEF